MLNQKQIIICRSNLLFAKAWEYIALSSVNYLIYVLVRHFYTFKYLLTYLNLMFDVFWHLCNMLQ